MQIPCRATNQAVIGRTLTTEDWVQSEQDYVGFAVENMPVGHYFFSSIMVYPCQHHSTNTSKAFTHLSKIPHNPGS